MKTRIVIGPLMLLLLFFWGCSSSRPIHLDSRFWKQQQGKRVGVIVLALPPAAITESVTVTRVVKPPDELGFVEGPWMDDAEYQPLRIAEMKPLQMEILELDAREFFQVQDLFVSGLRQRGFSAFKINEYITERSLPPFSGGLVESLYATADYRGLGKAYGADYLVVIRLVRYGPYCHYVYAYNDHMAVEAQTHAELIDTRTNRILWRAGYDRDKFQRSVEASCGNEEEIPVISVALKTLLSDAAVTLAQDFFRQ